MRFLLDQCVDARLQSYFSGLGHDVTRVARDYPIGYPDPSILAVAYREKRTVVTHDRDFGELVFVENQPHSGVIYLRLGSSPTLELAIARLDEVLANHAHELARFIVVTPQLIRVRS